MEWRNFSFQWKKSSCYRKACRTKFSFCLLEIDLETLPVFSLPTRQLWIRWSVNVVSPSTPQSTHWKYSMGKMNSLCVPCPLFLKINWRGKIKKSSKNEQWDDQNFAFKFSSSKCKPIFFNVSLWSWLNVFLINLVGSRAKVFVIVHGMCWRWFRKTKFDRISSISRSWCQISNSSEIVNWKMRRFNQYTRSVHWF